MAPYWGCKNNTVLKVKAGQDIKAYIVWVEVYIYSLSVSALDGDKLSASRPSRFDYTETTLITIKQEDVWPAGTDQAFQEQKIFCPYRNTNPSPQPTH
jgi:hypothetical protein